MKSALTILLFWAALAHGASTVTVPEGTTTYGPFSIGSLDNAMEIQLEPVSATFTTATFYIDMSEDKGKTWIGGICVGQMLPTLSKFHGGECPVPLNLTPTHFRVRVVLVGGSLTIAKIPNINSKQRVNK